MQTLVLWVMVICFPKKAKLGGFVILPVLKLKN